MLPGMIRTYIHNVYEGSKAYNNVFIDFENNNLILSGVDAAIPYCILLQLKYRFEYSNLLSKVLPSGE